MQMKTVCVNVSQSLLMWEALVEVKTNLKDLKPRSFLLLLCSTLSFETWPLWRIKKGKEQVNFDDIRVKCLLHFGHVFFFLFGPQLIAVMTQRPSSSDRALMSRDDALLAHFIYLLYQRLYGLVGVGLQCEGGGGNLQRICPYFVLFRCSCKSCERNINKPRKTCFTRVLNMGVSIPLCWCGNRLMEGVGLEHEQVSLE